MAGADTLRDTLAFYAPYRDRLLTPAQRAQLEQAPPPALVQYALGALAQPGGGLRLADWNADPLGLWPQWWLARASDTRARPRDGQLALSDGGLEWIVLLRETTGSAFSLSGDSPIADALAQAQAAAAAAVPGARVIAGGVPLHAEYAASRAHLEINTIGWGSIAGVLLLVFLAFRSLWPRLLMARVAGGGHGDGAVGHGVGVRPGAPADHGVRRQPGRLRGGLRPVLLRQPPGRARRAAAAHDVDAAARPRAGAADQRAGLRRAGPAAVPGAAADGAVLGRRHRRHLHDDGVLVPVDRSRHAAAAPRFSTWIVASFARYPRFGATRATWLVHARVRAGLRRRHRVAARQRRPAPAAGLAAGAGRRAARDRPPAGTGEPGAVLRRARHQRGRRAAARGGAEDAPRRARRRRRAGRLSRAVRLGAVAGAPGRATRR